MFIFCPPAINTIEVTDVCTNNFTVSWTAVNEEELSYTYTVTLSSPNMKNDTVDAMMNTSYNFTNLMPNTTYVVNILGTTNMCSGISNETMVTTLMEGAGVPQGELIVMHL